MYKEQWYEPFLKTLVTLASPHSLIILGMTRDFLKPSFFALLEEKYGMQCVLCPQEATTGDSYLLNNSTALDTGIFFCKLSSK